MSFGEQLQEVRRSNGMTQEQFAEALQVSRQAVQCRDLAVQAEV